MTTKHRLLGKGWNRRLRIETLEDRRMLAVITVNSALDNTTSDTDLTIREATLLVNSAGDANAALGRALTAGEMAQVNTTEAFGTNDTITFDAGVFNGEAADVIRLQTGQLVISEALHLDGGSQAVVISGDASGNDVLVPGTFITDIAASALLDALIDNNSRILDLTPSAGDEVRLTGLTITGGDQASDDGGGINGNDANLVIENSSISGNRTTNKGGGIYAYYGDVTLTGSTVSGNASGDAGGGIYTYSGAVTLTGSTVSGNTTTGINAAGGAIWTYSGGVTLNSSTVTGNSAGGAGGGIYVYDNPYSSPTFTIENSIVAGNTAVGTAADLNPDSTSTLTVNFSLIGDNTGSTLAEAQTADTNGNLIGSSNFGAGGIIDPLLGILANNGGPTLPNGAVIQTHALLPGSPALDAANSILTTDQRGQSVPIDLAGIANAAGGNGSDIGAYEAQSAPSADFVDDDIITGADFLAWQRGFGITVGADRTDGNADDDGDVDASDLAAWEATFGQPEATPLVANEQSAVSSQQSEGSNEALIDAAIAVERIRSIQVSEAPPLVANEPAFAETSIDQVFAAEATASTGLFADAYELPEANSGKVDSAESPWLADDLLERVFS